MTFKKLYKEYKNKPVLTFNGKDLSLYIDRNDFLSILEYGISLENKIDKIKEYITTRTPSDIGISGNKPKKYYTLSKDEVDYILELLEEIE